MRVLFVVLHEGEIFRKFNIPRIIHDDAKARLWYKQDDEYMLPKSELLMHITSPVAAQSPLHAALTHMLVSCLGVSCFLLVIFCIIEFLQDSLTEYVYDAHLAGLNGSFVSTGDGLGLSCGGYNQKLPEFVEYLFKHAKSYQIDPQRCSTVLLLIERQI